MIKYRMTIAYDGTTYFGWQAQKEKLAVAQVLQDTFERVFNRPITLSGASRTDAGVHALGQVATFFADLVIEPQEMMRAWNHSLPLDIAIRSLEKVSFEFSPYHNVVRKTYWYHFFLERPLPFVQRYGWLYRYNVDIEKMRRCLAVFIGTHDFRSFCTGDDIKETIRRIDAIELTYIAEYNAYRVAITGPKFLRYMIRRIVGACLEVASRTDLDENVICKILQAKNPEHILPNAPAKGLVLESIVYESDLLKGCHE